MNIKLRPIRAGKNEVIVQLGGDIHGKDIFVCDRTTIVAHKATTAPGKEVPLDLASAASIPPGAFASRIPGGQILVRWGERRRNRVHITYAIVDDEWNIVSKKEILTYAPCVGAS